MTRLFLLLAIFVASPSVLSSDIYRFRMGAGDRAGAMPDMSLDTTNNYSSFESGSCGTEDDTSDWYNYGEFLEKMALVSSQDSFDKRICSFKAILQQTLEHQWTGWIDVRSKSPEQELVSLKIRLEVDYFDNKSLAEETFLPQGVAPGVKWYFIYINEHIPHTLDDTYPVELLKYRMALDGSNAEIGWISAGESVSGNTIMEQILKPISDAFQVPEEFLYDDAHLETHGVSLPMRYLGPLTRESGNNLYVDKFGMEPADIVVKHHNKKVEPYRQDPEGYEIARQTLADARIDTFLNVYKGWGKASGTVHALIKEFSRLTKLPKNKLRTMRARKIISKISRTIDGKKSNALAIDNFIKQYFELYPDHELTKEQMRWRDEVIEPIENTRVFVRRRKCSRAGPRPGPGLMNWK